MPRIGIEFVVKHLPGAADPLGAPSKWYILLELSSGDADGRLRETLEKLLSLAVVENVASDAVIALSDAQRRQLWKLRESMSDVQRLVGGSIKNDVRSEEHTSELQSLMRNSYAV